MDGKMRKVILASKSPRRREIFAALKIPAEVLTTETDESYENGTPPGEIVCELARRKCEAAVKLAKEKGLLGEGDILVSADTIVYFEGEVMGKPQDRDDAIRMLRMLGGKKNQVYTGIAIYSDGRIETGDDHADVWFRELSEKDIITYVDSGEPMDKAGAYGMQERGGFFVEKMEGDFSTVIGFPVFLFGKMLSERFDTDVFMLMEK